MACNYSYMVLSFCDIEKKFNGRKVTDLPYGYLRPMRAYPVEFEIKSKGYLLVLRLSPVGFYQITGKKASDFVQSVLDLSEFYDRKEFLDFYFRIKNIKNIEILLSEVNHFFVNRHKILQAHPLDSVLQYIDEKKGMLEICKLSDSYNMSISTLNRYFNKYLGVSIGLYLRTIKFKCLFKEVIKGQLKLQEIAFKYNFFDQSHFHKEFKKFSGVSPKDLRKDLQLSHSLFEY